MSNQTVVEKKVRLINTIAVLVLKSDKYVQQRWDYNARHLIFNDKYHNTFAVRLVQNTKDNNYEVAMALNSGGQHLGVEKIKSKKHFVELMADIEFKTLLALKAAEHIKRQ